MGNYIIPTTLISYTTIWYEITNKFYLYDYQELHVDCLIEKLILHTIEQPL